MRRRRRRRRHGRHVLIADLPSCEPVRAAGRRGVRPRRPFFCGWRIRLDQCSTSRVCGGGSDRHEDQTFGPGNRPCVAAPWRPRAQEPAGQEQEPAATGGGRGGRAQEPEIRPYDRVITKDAKSDDGIFTVHRIKDRVYYEIPKERLGREFLWVSQIAKTTLGAGYGGQAAGNRVVEVGAARRSRSSCARSRTTSSPTPRRRSPGPSTPRTTVRS